MGKWKWKEGSWRYNKDKQEHDICLESCFTDFDYWIRTHTTDFEWWLEPEPEDLILHYDAEKGEIYKTSSPHFWFSPTRDSHVVLGDGTIEYCSPENQSYIDDIIRNIFISDFRPEHNQTVIKPEIYLLRLYDQNDESKKLRIYIGIKPYIFHQYPWSNERWEGTMYRYIYIDGTLLEESEYQRRIDEIDELKFISNPFNQLQVKLRYEGSGGFVYESELSDPIGPPAGIGDILEDGKESDMNSPVYDLMGRRVNTDNLKPGIYIRKGKKFVVGNSR